MQQHYGNAYVQRWLYSSQTTLQRKKGEGEDTLGADAPDVGVAGGESKTPSDQSKMAPGYVEQVDGDFKTPDGRIITKEQAAAESKVINSEGIYMSAYLQRYNALKDTYGLSQAELDMLSTKAGFMKQFKTGDIVLRMMSAEDSEGLATITDSNYSHSGIIQVKSGRVWVLDSYPGRKDSSGSLAEDSTTLIRFEEFYSDHGTEKIVRGIVLRVKGLSRKVRNDISALIDFYAAESTSFDREFKIDNGDYVLYCSELVWRILKEAGAPVLPPNEFDFTKERIMDLISQLETLIAIQESQGTDTKEAKDKLAKLKDLLSQFEGAAAEELYSPGSLERTEGLESITGFERGQEIEGTFKLIVVKGSVPDDTWDTPDPYVKYSGGLFGGGETSVKDDTTSPTWNESITELEYADLANVTLELIDSDLAFDDHLAFFHGDLRPVRPKGQTFVLSAGGATLTVRIEGVEGSGAFGPQAAREETY
jgi:hypothetical protein